MGRGELLYEILNLRFPNGYRNAKGLVYINKIQDKPLDELQDIWRKLKIKRGL